MKLGDKIIIINKRYTQEKCGLTGKIIQIDFWNNEKTEGIVYVLLDINKRICDINLCHVEKYEKQPEGTLELFV